LKIKRKTEKRKDDGAAPVSLRFLLLRGIALLNH
jgi:hypothetical protein